MHSTKKVGICLFLMCVIICRSTPVRAQSLFEPSEEVNKNRVTAVVVTESVLTTLAMYGLYKLWYSKHKSSNFHRFNDAKEWKQMDKIGHFFATYWISRGQYSLLTWCGVDQHKASLIGGGTALGFMSSIEIMDGYSSGWGYSWTDMAANLAGAGWMVGQNALWNEQRITPQFSVRMSPFAQYRPELLGNSYKTRWIKDYNGQTHWISFSLGAFSNGQIPYWTCLSIGYGANGMLGGHSNPSILDGEGKEQTFERYRQWYLSGSIDWTSFNSIKGVNSRSMLSLLNMYKVPFPTLEFNKVDKIKATLLYPSNK